MKRHLFLIICLTTAIILHAQQRVDCQCCNHDSLRNNCCNTDIRSNQKAIKKAGENYTPNTLIIFYDATKGDRALRKAFKKTGAEIIYDYKSFNGFAIKKPANMTLDQAISYFSKVKGVLTVNKDAIYHID